MFQSKKNLLGLALAGLGCFFVLAIGSVQAHKCGDDLAIGSNAYNTEKINDFCWITEDLLETMDGSVLSTDHCSGACAGAMLYTYAEASEACQKLGSEWRVPSETNFKNIKGGWGSFFDAGLNYIDYLDPGIRNALSIPSLPLGRITNGVYVLGNGLVNVSSYWLTDADPQGALIYTFYYGYYDGKDSSKYISRGHKSTNGSDLNAVRCVRDLRPILYKVSVGGQLFEEDGSYTANSDSVALMWTIAQERYGDSTNYYLNGVKQTSIPDTLSLNPGLNTFAFKVEHAGHVGEFSRTITVNITYTPVATVIAPTVTATNTPPTNLKPTWNWTSGGNGNGTFRYKLDNADLTTGATTITAPTNLTYTPATALTVGSHTLYVQEKSATGIWSASGSAQVTITAVETETHTYTIATSTPSGSSLSDKNFGIMLTTQRDGANYTGGTIKYKINGVEYPNYTLGSSVKVLQNASVGNTVSLTVQLLDGSDVLTESVFSYTLVGTGNENQIINTTKTQENLANVAKFSTTTADLSQLSTIKVTDGDKANQVKFDLSGVTTIASNKKSVTLTGNSNTLSIERTSSGGIDVVFDLAGTKLTADENWSGELLLPMVVTDSPGTYGVGTNEKLKTIFKVGDLDNKITTSKAVRIVVPNEGERMAMYFDKSLGSSGQWVDVPTCQSLGIATQAEATAKLAEDSDCYLAEDEDLIIYTKHFSFFSTFVSTVVKTSQTGGAGASSSISTGILATIKKFADMLGGASQSISVASGLNLDEVMIVTRDKTELTASDIVQAATGSAASRTNRLVSFAIGDTIATNNLGALDVDLGGFTKMHIAQNSKVTIKEAKNNQIIYTQGDGQIHYEFNKQNTDMSWEVRTKSVNAVIRGTTIEVAVVNGEQIYDLLKGTIDIEDQKYNKTYSLVAGQRLKVDANGNILVGKIGENLIAQKVATETATDASGKRRPVNFRDVPSGEWFASAVMALKNNYIVKGYSGNYFKPSQAISRAEALKIVLMAADQELDTSVSAKDLPSDVKTGDWYANYVATATQEKIVSGYGDDTFRPNGNITRSEALKIILGAKGITVSGGKNVNSYFSDISANDWCANYVAYAYEHNFIKGYSDGTFRPNAPVTRAEFAKLVADIMGL